MRRATVLACALLVAGCGSGATGGGLTLTAPPPVPERTARSRVFVIVMENKEQGDVIGSSSAPYVNSLARRYASATGFFVKVWKKSRTRMPMRCPFSGMVRFTVTTRFPSGNGSPRSIAESITL